jgi:hypothetical protein
MYIDRLPSDIYLVGQCELLLIVLFKDAISYLNHVQSVMNE